MQTFLNFCSNCIPGRFSWLKSYQIFYVYRESQGLVLYMGNYNHLFICITTWLYNRFTRNASNILLCGKVSMLQPSGVLGPPDKMPELLHPSCRDKLKQPFHLWTPLGGGGPSTESHRATESVKGKRRPMWRKRTTWWTKWNIYICSMWWKAKETLIKERWRGENLTKERGKYQVVEVIFGD